MRQNPNLLNGFALAWLILSFANPLIAQPQFRSVFRGTSGGSLINDYFEITWTPNTDLTGYSVVFVYGSANGNNCGLIDNVVSLNGFSTESNGIFLFRGEPISPPPAVGTSVHNNGSFSIDNNVRTFFLVKDYAPSGADSDSDDDGMIDATFTFGTSVVAGLSIEAGTSCVYADEVVGGVVIEDAGYTPDILFLDNGSWFGANTDPGSGMDEIVVTPGEAHSADAMIATQYDGQMLTAGATSSPLPIELLYFQAKRVGDAIHLAWETATEENNALMAVERSKDGRSFAEIGQRKGHGTTSVPQYYRFVDEQPLNGINYYRLRQEDFDGAINYHSVIAVPFLSNDNKRLTLFPSLVSDQLNISLGEAIKTEGALRIIDAMGRVIQEASLGRGVQQESLDVSQLTNGRYYLSVAIGREILMASFVKQ